ncbi:MAG: 50S ribosome-binding GTPase, partial [Candidatus Sumerlaeaceae bacterium]|nr:50S ribosome-binding GTPase [Candidatus Sumerlaeaceae bacterium]
SLLNALTGAGVLEEDKLFATLDPTTRKIILPSRQPLLLSDTVGFIRKLPHTLVDAFKATLEEAQLAAMLIHVLDASHPGALEQRAATEEVLSELKALHKPTVLVLNKVDRIAEDDRMMLGSLARGYDHVVATSTLTGEGLDRLAGMLDEIAGHNLARVELRLPPDRHDLVALVHREGQVESSSYDESDAYSVLRAVVPGKLKARLAPYVVSAPEF